MMKKKNKAFTLIELLIVVAIIGILATITLVILTSAKSRAAYVSFKSEMKSINTAAAICHSGGGKIQDGSWDVYICDKTAVTNAKYPKGSAWPKACVGFSIFDANYPANNGTPDAWSVQATCVVGSCSANCSESRCVFTGC